MKKNFEDIGLIKDNQINIWVPKDKIEFDYNDGDEIENYIFESIKSCNDRSIDSDEIKSYIKDWPSLYHLDRRRTNILRPFKEFLKGKNILEIGCGCGALTRYLGEIDANVISIEGSKRRALIARERCKDLENIEILNVTSEYISNLKEFDVVILNGVLEYSTKFFGENGASVLLNSVISHLNDTGILLLAIENQLGLKYFAGHFEDHAGIPMYGINNSYRKNEFRTWGRLELMEILENSGFQSIDLYLPLPDYKLPVSIVTPLGWKNYAKDLDKLAIESAIQDPQRTVHESFSLEIVYEKIWKNGLAADLSNSFLFIAGKDKKLPNLLSDNSVAFYYSDGRSSEFCKTLNFIIEENKIKVRASKLNNDSISKQNISFKHKILKEDSFYYGNSFHFELLQVLNRSNWTEEEIMEWAKRWYFILKHITGLIGDEVSLDYIIDGKYLDITPFNIIKDKEGNLHVFDSEWELEDNVTMGYLLFRGIYHSLMRVTTCAKPLVLELLDIEYLINKIMNGLGFLNVSAKCLDYRIQDYKFTLKILGPTNKYNENPIENWGKLHSRDEIQSLYQTNERLKLHNEELKLHNESKIQELELKYIAIKNSTSWKITKPLRYITTLIRNL